MSLNREFPQSDMLQQKHYLPLIHHYSTRRGWPHCRNKWFRTEIRVQYLTFCVSRSLTLTDRIAGSRGILHGQINVTKNISTWITWNVTNAQANKTDPWQETYTPVTATCEHQEVSQEVWLLGNFAASAIFLRIYCRSRSFNRNQMGQAWILCILP